jgi:hypothetical protein
MTWSICVTVSLLPKSIREKYEILEWKHACAVLKSDFPNEWKDIIEILDSFKLKKSDILKPGGRKSLVAVALDSPFLARGWEEKSFDIRIVIDHEPIETPTHRVDCYKNGVAIEVEWNNKDPFFDRDLNNFRLLYELRAISVGVIVTRADHLQALFVELGRGHSYGASTTHMSKLIPRIEGGGGGGCPILVLGITRGLYEED